jgi:hypothetical protein
MVGLESANGRVGICIIKKFLNIQNREQAEPTISF